VNGIIKKCQAIPNCLALELALRGIIYPMKRISLTLLILSLLLSACGLTPPTAEPPLGEWLLTGINGAPPYPAAQIRLVFEDAQSVSGFSGCNSYSGEYTLQGSTLEFGNIAATAMACVDGAIAEAERAYFDALGQVDTLALDGDRLTLSGGSVTLEFQRAPGE
jgi:heat shock protein HslJ